MLNLKPELFGSLVRQVAKAADSERPGAVSKQMVLTYLKASQLDLLGADEKSTLQYLTSWAWDGTFEIIEDDAGWITEAQIVRYVTWLRDVSDESGGDRFPVAFSLN